MQTTSKNSRNDRERRLTTWTVTQSSSAMLGHPSSAYRTSISDRLFCETGYSEGLFYLVLAKFNSPFFCVLLVQLRQHTDLLSEVKARSFSYQVTNFCHKESKFHVEFYHKPHVGTDVGVSYINLLISLVK